MFGGSTSKTKGILIIVWAWASVCLKGYPRLFWYILTIKSPALDQLLQGIQ